jgi:hypothetical protein
MAVNMTHVKSSDFFYNKEKEFTTLPVVDRALNWYNAFAQDHDARE